MIDEYKCLFISPKGYYYSISNAYMAARVLNPLVASHMDMEQIVDAIRDLAQFGFDEFRASNGIITDLIEEIPAYLAVVNATNDSFWSLVEGAEKYDADLKKKAEKNPEK